MMADRLILNVYWLASGFNGGVKGKVPAFDPGNAIRTFARLHALHPEQVCVLVWFPLMS